MSKATLVVAAAGLATLALVLAVPAQAHADYRFVSEWGVKGTGGVGEGTDDGRFDTPRGVAVNPATGQVYVADASNHRIQRFSATGAFLGKWGTEGAGDGQFDQPRGVAVNPATGQVFVTDAYNHRIQRFSAAGAFLGAWGSVGSAVGQFAFPSGIAVNQHRVVEPHLVPTSGYVYVADSSNHRIQWFRPVGPAVRITAAPSGKTRKRVATFRFRADEAGSRFKCKLDRGGWKRCSSPKRYRNLKRKRHTFKVRATDRAGDVGKPATRRWRVVK